MQTQSLPSLLSNQQPEKPKSDAESVIYLPRGGIYIKTQIGPIQFGMPPETVKDSLNLKLEVPYIFVLPNNRFDRKFGINVAEFEFPAYFNFFCRDK